MAFEISHQKKIKKKVIILLSIIFISILSFILIHQKSFRIIQDDCKNIMIIGETCQFKYQGGYSIKINNDNINYQNGIITAKSEGISTLSILSKDGKILFEKIIKVFPN